MQVVVVNMPDTKIRSICIHGTRYVNLAAKGAVDSERIYSKEGEIELEDRDYGRNVAER